VAAGTLQKDGTKNKPPSVGPEGESGKNREKMGKRKIETALSEKTGLVFFRLLAADRLGRGGD
jgi:hypothetical protein